MDFKSPGKVELKIKQKHELTKKAEEISGRELLTVTLFGNPGEDQEKFEITPGNKIEKHSYVNLN